MGCAGSAAHRVSGLISKDDGVSSAADGEPSSLSADVLLAAGEADLQRMAELVQLGLDLSLLAIEGGHAKESDFHRAAIEARVRVCAVDALAFWRLQRPEGAHSETLSCSAADGAGADSLIGRTLAIGDIGGAGASPPAPAAFTALLRSTRVDAPPVVVDPSNRAAIAELQSRYGRAVHTAVYVPVNAPSVWEASASVQYGVLEAIVHASPDSDTKATGAAIAPSNGAHRSPLHLRPPSPSRGRRGFGSHARVAPDELACATTAAAAAASAVSDVTMQQLRQLGGHLAASLQTFALLHSDEQGERLLYRMMPKHIVAQLQQRRTAGAAADAATAAAPMSPHSPNPKPDPKPAAAAAAAAAIATATASATSPSAVAMPADENFIVESCERAFVLFCDLVGFTSYCARRQPAEVVATLNSLFATFDALLPKHRVHKVTTIGDCYVAAAGLSFMTSAAPQRDLLAFALDLVGAVHGFHTADGEELRVRIGIHVGPVAAGVVGIAMPRYCLIGETVTVAEQLEERALPNRILVSRAVHCALLEPLSGSAADGARGGGGGSGGNGGGNDGDAGHGSGDGTADGGDAAPASSAADVLGIAFEPLEPHPDGLDDTATSSASSATSSASAASAAAAAAPLLVIETSKRQRSASLLQLEGLATANLSYFRGRTQPSGQGIIDQPRLSGAGGAEGSWEAQRRGASGVNARCSSSLDASCSSATMRDLRTRLSWHERRRSSRELPPVAVLGAQGSDRGGAGELEFPAGSVLAAAAAAADQAQSKPVGSAPGGSAPLPRRRTMNW